jgi:hypothetical protein
MQAYCSKCKAKREMCDPTPVFMTIGWRAIPGVGRQGFDRRRRSA